MRLSRTRDAGRAGLIACALSIGFWCAPTSAQEPGPLTPTQDAPKNFDPSDVYFQGWLLSRDAEKLAAEERFTEAYEKLERAQKLFNSVAEFFPLWKPDMVKGRQAQTVDFIGRIGPQVVKEREAKDQAMAYLEGGVIVGEEPEKIEGNFPEAPIQPTQNIETLESRRIAELEDQVKDLEKSLQESGNPNASDRNASRARDLAKQRDLARAEMKRAQDELANLRRRISSQPVQQDMQRLSGKIQTLEREKAALAQALNNSQSETRQAQGQVNALQIERARLAQMAADLKQSLEIQQKTQGEVIAGQQKQLRNLRNQLEAKNDELAKASQRIASLESTLKDVRSDFDDLRQERDNLLREKEQMAALLDLNEGSRIQELIDQNMGLAKQLREANEQVDRLNKSNNATQDELIEAMRDLALAKDNINIFKKEKAAQDQRMAELENRLRNEVGSLSNADPAEAETLRAIIQKQLRIQDRRRQAAELLVEAVGERAQEDESIREALDLFNRTELALSPDELKIVRNRRVDDEFTSPIPRTKEQVDASLTALERQNLPYTDAAKRAFLKQRFQSARELFEIIAEQNPGDIDNMCRLGIVQLKLDNPLAASQVFSDAVTIDSTNPYAYRMLGFSLMQMEDYEPALNALKKSVELAPSNAEGRVVLGKLYFDVGQEQKAEAEFKSAIEFDDLMDQAHFNLAFLYAKQGKKKQGLAFYRSALERGAEPDPDLEKRLGN